MRSTLTLLHRYLGLGLAGFLVLAGLTGSVIALYHELDEGLNPQLYRAPSEGTPLSVGELVARVERAEPRARVSAVDLEIVAGRSVIVRVAPRARAGIDYRQALGFDELFVDPVDGEIVGRRLWGECCFAREQIVPFLYSLHYSLHLPDRVGVILMGLVALAWALDCFVGLALTLPRGTPSWRRWARAFRIETKASRYRALHDTHQASGLWLWALLLMLAVSGVAMNLRDEVFRPIVGAFSELSPTALDRAQQLGIAPGERTLEFPEAIAAARRMAAERGWPEEPVYAFHVEEIAGFGVGVIREGERADVGLGASWIYVSDRDGSLVAADIVGEGSAGDVFAQLQFPLHSGHIFGLPGRIAISLLGLATAVLSVTGVYVWAVKRAARQVPRIRRAMRRSSALEPRQQ